MPPMQKRFPSSEARGKQLWLFSMQKRRKIFPKRSEQGVGFIFRARGAASTDVAVPDLRDFQKDFGIKRTNKPFSRQPIDLTLEQTINADAARTLTGITHLTNSISARQRWARSHDIRSTIITACVRRNWNHQEARYIHRATAT
ncbi:uncharacterized protein TNCV_4368181 [Trichonephila clavipes]|nr:uncharacterized protein TNCV_4368181 [Trichonephila clavipes]